MIIVSFEADGVGEDICGWLSTHGVDHAYAFELLLLLVDI